MPFVLCSTHLQNQHFNKKASSSDVVHTINKFKHLFNKMFALFRPTVCFTNGILDKRNLQKLYLSVFLPLALGGFFSMRWDLQSQCKGRANWYTVQSFFKTRVFANDNRNPSRKSLKTCKPKPICP